jgi:hypothetical protein
MAKLCIRGSMRVDPLPNRIDPRGGAVLKGDRLPVYEGRFVVQKFRTAPPHLEVYWEDIYCKDPCMGSKEIRHMYIRTCIDRSVLVALSLSRRALMNCVCVCVCVYNNHEEGRGNLVFFCRRLHGVLSAEGGVLPPTALSSRSIRPWHMVWPLYKYRSWD